MASGGGFQVDSQKLFFVEDAVDAERVALHAIGHEAHLVVHAPCRFLGGNDAALQDANLASSSVDDLLHELATDAPATKIRKHEDAPHICLVLLLQAIADRQPRRP